MPTYEYKREDGTVFEITQSINDAPLTACPDTGQPVKRIISGGGGVVYKGTGWHITDYKNGNGHAASNGTEAAKEESSPKETAAEKTEPAAGGPKE